MKPAISLLACIPLVMISCSPYQKVSLNGFQECHISVEERRNLSYILKSHPLCYSDAEGRVNNNFYGDDHSTIITNNRALILENIVIPKGARGILTDSDDASFTIDFGDGVKVPFDVYHNFNRAKSEIVVGSRTYHIEHGGRSASLYFDCNGL